MRTSTRLAIVGGATAALAATVFLVNCVTDPRENDAVQVISTCDLTQLDSDASSPQATVKAYVQAAQQVATQATTVSAQLVKICNEMDTDLGQATGMDPVSACTPISKRAAACIANTPPGPPGPAWFNFAAPPSCKLDPTVESTCIATCAASCDVATKCKGNLQGTCAGNCSGTCATTSDAGACTGSCEGSCAPQLSVCTGECQGGCADHVLAGGVCTTGCWVGVSGPSPITGPFFGYCGGTCTGSCTTGMTTVPANGGFPAVPDAGPSEAGPPPDLDAAPSGMPGNCPFPGFCTGLCDMNSSGECFAGCTGVLTGGVCQSVCAGDCIAGNGSGCSPMAALIPDGGPPVTCSGTCLSATAPDAGSSCSGVCNGTCSQPMTNALCAGAVSCGQNAECTNACQAESQLSVTCTPPPAGSVEVEAVSDPQLYAEFKKYGPQLAVVLQTISALQAAEGAIDQQTIADFAAIGATGDLVRACVTEGSTSATQAHTTLSALASADPTVVVTAPAP